MHVFRWLYRCKFPYFLEVNFCLAPPSAKKLLGYGVIGSPADSGSVSLGSSPGTPAQYMLFAVKVKKISKAEGLVKLNKISKAEGLVKLNI